MKKHFLNAQRHNHGLSCLWNVHGSVYCRKEHLGDILDSLENPEDIVSICSNGIVGDRYIFNPTLAPYQWEQDGVITSSL